MEFYRRNIIYAASFLLLTGWLGQLPSLILFGFGGTTNELDLVGNSFVPLKSMLTLIVLLFFITLTLAICRPRSVFVSDIANIEFALSLLFVLLLTIYAIPVVLHGPALSLQMDRYEYYRLPYVSSTGWSRDFIAILVLPLAAIAVDKKLMFKSVTFIGLFLVLLLMRGEKFAGIYLVLLFFMAGIIAQQGLRFKFLLKFFILTLALVAFVILYYTLTRPDLDFDLSVTSVILRIIKQGQLSYFFMINDGLEFSANNFTHMFNYYGERIFSMSGMMDFAMPIEQRKIHTGGLAGGFPAVVYFSGAGMTLTLIISAALIWLLFFFISSLMVISYHCDKFVLFLATVFMIYPVRSVFKAIGSGDLYLLTSPYFIICAFVVVNLRIVIKGIHTYER